MQNIDKNENYNDVMKKLQDYMLDEANIKKALEMKINSTNRASTLKDSNKINYEKQDLIKKPALFSSLDLDNFFETLEVFQRFSQLDFRDTLIVELHSKFE